MPISTNPNATAPYWLPCDDLIPLKERPVFLVRFMTTKDLELHAELMREAQSETDDVRCAAKLMEAVRLGVRSWRNFKDAAGRELDFTDQNFFDALTDRERWAVAWSYPGAVRLTRVELGHFVSPAPSAGARDAATPAEPPAASVSTTP